ncbi:MAG: response regulator, partial [Syntrophorhabdaceae bacterium]|nr:response regulator [Syntrophorhabdaceae bacterium]
EVLESYGYRVIEARDGEEAVRIFNERKDIDLIITDLIMPKKNGWKVYEEVRRLKESVKVIFISGYARNIMFRLETKDVSHNFLQKPLSANTLLKKVREALLSG